MSKQIHFSSLIVALIFGLVTGSQVQAQTFDAHWEGDSSPYEYMGSSNWSDNTSPDNTRTLLVDVTGSNSPVFNSGTYDTDVKNMGDLYVGYNNAGELSFDGGYGAVRDPFTIGNDSGNGTGTVNMSGGVMDSYGGDIRASGTLNITGGEYYATGGDGNGNDIGGTVHVSSSGKYASLGRTHSGNGTDVSGGVLHVQGGNATMVLGRANNSDYNQYSDADVTFQNATTLKLGIDSDGISPIHVDNANTGLSFTVHDDTILDPYFDGIDPQLNTSYEILNWTDAYTLYDGNNTEITTAAGVEDLFSFADSSNWEMNATIGDSGSLSVTYVPEPSSLLLLGLAGLLLMKRRRV